MRETLQELREAFRTAAARLVLPLSLPDDLSDHIINDAAAIGEQLTQQLGHVAMLQVKVELFGTGVCSRWHMDNYIGRAIVSYNCSGTMYIEDQHVDFWELENCGHNECVVKDKSHSRSVDVGDILFMKGKTYPGEINGLVHKAPELQFHSDGGVMNRLCLKVDVPEQELLAQRRPATL